MKLLATVRWSAMASLTAAAKQMLINQGGGELTIKGLDGKIRSKDTIPPGNDPNPPRDRTLISPPDHAAAPMNGL